MLALILQITLFFVAFLTTVIFPSFQAGLFIDKGVKTTNASAEDPREYLCLDNSARYVLVCKI